jgi:small subunit ribosomal protein S17
MADETTETDEQTSQPAEPAAPQTPKQRRQARRLRSRSGGADRALSPAERQAERERLRAERKAARRRRRLKLRERARAARAERPAAAPTPPREHGPGRPKIRQGVVTSAKPDKTIKVRIDRARPHSRYGKIVRASSTLHAHDERNDAHEGDVVRVVESRPLSRTKRWRLLEVLERAR